jgi:hypothetical protein
MTDLYAMGSPNVVKIYIAFEEMGLPYTVHPVNVFGEAQPVRRSASPPYRSVRKAGPAGSSRMSSPSHPGAAAKPLTEDQLELTTVLRRGVGCMTASRSLRGADDHGQ